MAASEEWFRCSESIRGVLLDITGVLYESGAGGGTAIEGSVDAVRRLKQSGIPVRFCTNETQSSRKTLVQKLQKFGFELEEKEVFSPVPAVCHVLKERHLRPYLLVYPGVLAEFDGIELSNPNCVVMGDAGVGFTHDNLNKAFQLLMSLDNPVFISLGKGKYYKDSGQLVLDVGAFSQVLEYACGVEAEVVGKPSPAFFTAALQDMGVVSEHHPKSCTTRTEVAPSLAEFPIRVTTSVLYAKALMIGDDIINDVGGAQACGMKGLQVRTGKYRLQDECHPDVKPDGFVDNLSQAVTLLLSHRKC